MSSSSCGDMKERLTKLRDLRSKLCDKENNWSEAFKVRDWLFSELSRIDDICSSNNSTKEDISKEIKKLVKDLNIKGDRDDK